MSRSRPVVAYYSATAADPKLHLDIRCVGLERLCVHPAYERHLARKTFSSLTVLARQEPRPCRVCALEPVLDHALTERGTRRRRKVFATFTSQPAYVADERRFRRNDVTDSGVARLERIASRLGLEVVATKIGPAAFGFVPRTGIDILERNLRTLWCEDITELPSAAYISCLWTFTDDAPPEFGGGALDVWEAAALLSA